MANGEQAGTPESQNGEFEEELREADFLRKGIEQWAAIADRERPEPDQPHDAVDGSYQQIEHIYHVFMGSLRRLLSDTPDAASQILKTLVDSDDRTVKYLAGSNLYFAYFADQEAAWPLYEQLLTDDDPEVVANIHHHLGAWANSEDGISETIDLDFIRSLPVHQITITRVSEGEWIDVEPRGGESPYYPIDYLY